MGMSNYGFMKAIHEVFQPKGYVEIGVAYGDSLIFATCPAVGIDPHPMLRHTLRETTKVYPITSDSFFGSAFCPLPAQFDLAYIDGMHLAEFALRDFYYLEEVISKDGVILFDDVLPYAASIAGRKQPPGAWTGDVWKVIPVLRDLRPDLEITLVNTSPTGTLMVRYLDPTNQTLRKRYANLEPRLQQEEDPPSEILFRHGAVEPEEVLKKLHR